MAILEFKKDWFKVFLNNTTQKKVIIGYTLMKLGQPSNSSIFSNLGKNFTVSIIGGGTGQAELRILNGLQVIKNNKINIHYEDPLKGMHDSFIKNLKQYTTAGFNLRLASKPSMEEVESKKFCIRKSHLILAIHSLYYVSDWQNGLSKSGNVLSKIKNSLASGGVALIALNSKKSDKNLFENQFTPLVHGKKITIPSGEKIINALKRLKVKFSHEIVPCILFLDSLFKKNTFKPNPDGEKLLSFMIQKNWKKVDKKLRKKIGAYITKKARRLGNRRVFITKDCYIWIKK